MTCPVCGNNEAISEEPEIVGYTDINCLRCGIYRTDKVQRNLFEEDEEFSIKLSHWICKNETRGEILKVDYRMIRNLRDKLSLPDVKEQADNFILFLGSKLVRPDQKLNSSENYAKIANRVGAIDKVGLVYILEYLSGQYLIQNTLTDSQTSAGPVYVDGGFIKMKPQGWEYYNTLKTSSPSSRKAFMAMQFNNDLIDKAYKHWKEAVTKTGFELYNLSEMPKAGLIDNRLRSEIRNCSLLLADLTNDNNGAYWEAGYAEGLEKPVIYLCEQKHFDEFKTHFDTNHHFTIIYEMDNLDEAAEQLKATIRTTLPHLAIMQD